MEKEVFSELPKVKEDDYAKLFENCEGNVKEWRQGMTAKEVNRLFENKNLIELLGHTLLGISIVKERFKEYKNDSGCYGFKLLEGVNNVEELVKKCLFEIVN